jgi:hypothetical protein
VKGFRGEIIATKHAWLPVCVKCRNPIRDRMWNPHYTVDDVLQLRRCLGCRNVR